MLVLLGSASEQVPFTILAFFPEYRMNSFRVPSLEEMLEAYTAVRAAGRKNVRLGNIGIFAATTAEVEQVLKVTGAGGRGPEK